MTLGVLSTNVTFDQIRCFLSLAQTLNFTRSAILLGLTQPSVSRLLRNLESALGVQLLMRNKHEVRLTSQGRELRREIEPLMRAFQGALERTVEQSQGVRGSLTVGCLPEVGQHHFYPKLIEFQNEHPQVDLHVRYLLAHEILELLKAGELDFGITPQPQISETFRSYQIVEERAVLITRRNNCEFAEIKSRLKAKALAKAVSELHFVGYSRVDSLLNGFLKAHFPPADVSKLLNLSSVNSYASMIQMLQSRDCLAVMPLFSVQNLIQEGKLKQVFEKYLSTKLYLVETEKIVPSAKGKAFREYLLGKRISV